jgi:hypothetical protein
MANERRPFFVLAVGVIVGLSIAGGHAAQDKLPASLSDAEFWSLTDRLSEPNGVFRSDNLLSNEMALSNVATQLAARVKPGGVYLGVGPEQNFTYIAAMRPRIALITDIRRGNLHLHLMYKALFELSADRAEFVSRLFTKPRPAGLTDKSTAADLMNAYWDITTSAEPVYNANLQAINDLLVNKHGFPLSAEDLNGIAYVYHAFYWYGPAINYSSSSTGGIGGRSTYADLMMTVDATGVERSYLATEENFRFLKTLHGRNLIVPVVGDFAGPKALRAVGDFLRQRNAVVTAFYVSNVESYLTRGGLWPTFCQNVATMPIDDASVFIRPGGSSVMLFSGSGTTPPPAQTGSAATVAGRASTVIRFVSASGSGRSPFGVVAEEVKSCR